MKCRACGAKVIYAVYAATGRKMPLDAEPGPGGTLRVVTTGGPSYTERKAYYVSKPDREGREDLYKSHFETCPEAAKFRRTGA